MKQFNKNNPFKTPEGYFKGFNDRLMQKLSEEKSSIPKKEGFEVPENYFDSLHTKIIDKLATEEPKVIALNSYKKYYYAAAAIAAVVLLFFGLNTTTSEALTFEDLAEADIESYFENNTYDLSAYEIAEVIPLHELEINDILTNGFNEDKILDYLEDNIADFDELNFEDYE